MTHQPPSIIQHPHSNCGGPAGFPKGFEYIKVHPGMHTSPIDNPIYRINISMGSQGAVFNAKISLVHPGMHTSPTDNQISKIIIRMGSPGAVFHANILKRTPTCRGDFRGDFRDLSGLPGPRGGQKRILREK